MTKTLISQLLLATSIALVAISPTQAAEKKVTVRIGWNALAGTTPISGTMQNEKLFEKYAKQRGYEIETQWQQFIAGPPANEAMVAGRLDLDMDLASAAYVSRIRQGVPAVIIGTQASHLSNAIMVRPGSKVKTVTDLQGKTVGLLTATSAHYTLASIVKQHLGKTLQEANVRVVNMPPAESIKMPQGLDAAVIWVPFQFIGPQLGLSELLIDANGQTGPAYEKPGIRVEEIKKAWGYPEGYFTDRLYLTAREQFAEEYPDLVVAFLLARWEAQDIVASSFDRAVEVANNWWKQPTEVAKLAAATYPENTNIRNAPVLLEWDALSLIKTSEFFQSLGTIDKALTWDELQSVMLKGAEFQKRAWEQRGKQPSLEKLRAGFEGSAPGWSLIVVNGGEPVWRYKEVTDWGKRFYKPGPFGGNN
jgi:NitT/TauT family transport system substrate-binding protein